ncbi:hypothetical protein IFM89_020907 [Coptis chinensis]|uniref:Uncharacterized protein n=1 Tax=Coptis chinensis TaxID=261450 RepID=A0A835LN02_9MAGN|nr:hypothetical protein IFM89_020907 [Coptis chinensis]
MGNLKNALIAILVPLPSIAFYLVFLHHFNISKSTTAKATDGSTSVDGTLHAIWTCSFNHPHLLAVLLFFINVDILFWLISLIQSSHWMIDLYWTVIPVMLVNYYASHPLSKFNVFRSMVVTSLTWVWSIRLSHSYFRRERWQWGAREDWRFTDMREQYGKRWWWVSFFAVYIAQQVLMMGVCLPMYAIHSVEKPWNTWDTIATIICSCGIALAYFADTQLHEFVSRNIILKEQGKPTEIVLKKGLWQYSRHQIILGSNCGGGDWQFLVGTLDMVGPSLDLL